MVSKNTSNTAPQSLPITSNTTSPVSNLPPVHKSEQSSVFKAEGTPTSGGQVNRDKNEGVIFKRSIFKCYHPCIFFCLLNKFV